MSGEVAGRTGLAKSFLGIYPEVKRRIEADEINTLGGRAAAAFGQGYPAELINAINEGADALLRGLTGAGMPESEAADSAALSVSLTDDRETRIQKLDGLERALRFVVTEQGRGRGGEDLRRTTFAIRPSTAEPQGNRYLVGKAKAAGGVIPKPNEARSVCRRWTARLLLEQ